MEFEIPMIKWNKASPIIKWIEKWIVKKKKIPISKTAPEFAVKKKKKIQNIQLVWIIPSLVFVKFLCRKSKIFLDF